MAENIPFVHLAKFTMVGQRQAAMTEKQSKANHQ
jgi:hypothetical protein